MSKNITIGEGGTSRAFGAVDCLRVASGSDQYALWVPESERVLTTKSIDKNGIYQASDDGVYGWNSVFVNVPTPDSVTGKDGDGDTAVVSPDPDTGELIEQKVPDSIEVITSPTVPSNTYVDGQSVVPGDMVVKAYLTSGEEYGIVPNGEIVLNPNKAVYDSGAYTPGSAEASYGGDTSEWPYPAITSIPTGSVLFASTASQEETFAITGGYIVVFDATGVSTPIVVFSTESGASVQRRVHYPSHPNDDFIQTINLGNTDVTYNGTTYYYATTSIWQASSITIPSCEMDETQSTYKQVATILFDGEITIRPAGSSQTITVSWPRPGDGAILETTFDITVQQSFGGASGGGGQAGETGAGRND